jgi:AcrR family transcriptional regulator
MRDPERTKESILCAAHRVIAEKGMSAMTLEEVACAAAISKGGLLHHFSSKQDLIVGITKHMLAEFAEEVEEFRRQDPAEPGAFTRALLRANLSSDPESSKVCLAFMTEARTFPASLELVREHAEDWQRRIDNDGLDPVVASIVRYAAEGLMFTEMWGVPLPSNFDAIVRRLLQLAGAKDQPLVHSAPKE